MRLFFAVELPAEVRAELGRLRPSSGGADYRWVEPALLHVTLAFLGQQPPELLPRLEELATAAARSSQPGRLRIGEAGSFGGQRTPRVLWVGLAGDLDRLNDLYAHVCDGLRGAGVAVEERAFRPHITLARRRERARGGAPAGWPPQQLAHSTIPLDDLVLFESRLSPRGPTYLPLFRAPLGRAA